MSVSEINAASSTTFFILSTGNFVAGIVGLTLNLVIFTRPTLRRQPCAFYFFAATCFNLYVILVVIPVRILSNNFLLEGANYNLVYCKLQTYSFYVARTIACWLIVLAALDRYLHSSTSASLRQWSSLKTARIASAVISVVIVILYVHMIAYFDILNVPNQFGRTDPTCAITTSTYRAFLGFWYMVFYSLAPSFLMFVFGLLTVRNLRRRRRVLLQTTGVTPTARRTDAQLLGMLITQILVIAVCTLPFCIQRLYVSFTGNVVKSTFRLAQESLAFQIVGGVTYIAHSSSFYTYTLSGTIFRKELRRIFLRSWRTQQQTSQHDLTTQKRARSEEH